MGVRQGCRPVTVPDPTEIPLLTRTVVAELLRRKRGRPGRPGQPWETKKQAHKLNRVDGVRLKDLADQYGVSTSTVGRWVKEVDAVVR